MNLQMCANRKDIQGYGVAPSLTATPTYTFLPHVYLSLSHTHTDTTNKHHTELRVSTLMFSIFTNKLKIISI